MKAAIFCADGFETCEMLITVDLLRRSKIEIDMVSMKDTLSLTTSHNVVVQGDKLFSEINADEYDALIIPGGLGGTKALSEDDRIRAMLLNAKDNQYLCAICAGPSVLGRLGLYQGKQVTCYPGWESYLEGATYTGDKVTQDGKFITGKGMGATIEFAAKIIENLLDTQTAESVLASIQYK
ncbi:MAG: DJ-1/PfpI family protein [Erysipelotrichaceae bacterium]|nr:DJ-1/PfpI family protein [Erysipelotrichaceae bacterium]